MPCDDITENLQLILDPEDRFEKYELIKKTCGRAVGESSLLSEWIANRTVDEFKAITVDEFLDEFACTDETEEFLYLKHFFALKSAIGVLTGELSGSINDACKVESLAFDEKGTELMVLIEISSMTQKIKSCGRCVGCGTKKKVATAPAL